MDEPSYRVVVNGDGHYSMWPADKDTPAGWTAIGWEGGREATLEEIKALAYKPLPPEYVAFIKVQREIANREARAEGRQETHWPEPEEERLRFLAQEEERRRRGE